MGGLLIKHFSVVMHIDVVLLILHFSLMFFTLARWVGYVYIYIYIYIYIHTHFGANEGQQRDKQ